MGHVHVKDKQTGHEYVVAEHLFNPEAHERTGKPTRDAHGDLAGVRFRQPLGTRKQAAKKTADKKAAAPAAESGQKAETEKE